MDNQVLFLDEVDGTLIQKELGFTPPYDLKTGWHETINQMRNLGSLWFYADD